MTREEAIQIINGEVGAMSEREAVAIFGRWVHSGGVGVATEQMIYFSTRKRLEELYKEWLKENPTVKDCPFNVITFLSAYLDEQKITEKIGNPVLRKSNLQ